jgi:hypothetical protein
MACNGYHTMMAVVARWLPGHCGVRVACSRAFPPFRPHEAAALHALSTPSSSRWPFQMVSLQSSLILSDENGGPPPGSPPTCMSLLITLSLLPLPYLPTSQVRRPVAVNSSNDFTVRRDGLLPYLLILSEAMASPLCTKNQIKGYFPRSVA